VPSRPERVYKDGNGGWYVKVSVPTDPALCRDVSLGFWATSAERYGRVFWALTVSEANYYIRRYLKSFGVCPCG
jgi:hypothetical protein